MFRRVIEGHEEVKGHMCSEIDTVMAAHFTTAGMFMSNTPIYCCEWYYKIYIVHIVLWRYGYGY